MAEKKVRHLLQGGPYDKGIIFLTAGANTTITFGLNGFYGRYVMASGHMEWKEQYKDISEYVITGPVYREKRVKRTLKVILGEAA